VLGCPIRKSADLMLVCSSPQLIAAYHVLLRLLEPRHPPCALICFKTIQIFYGVLPPLIDLKRSKSYSVLQLFFPICQRAIPCFQRLADVVIMNHQTTVFTASTPFHFKRTSATARIRTICGGYRSRTDDPLLAKQVL
jgi:hypothetical protein